MSPVAVVTDSTSYLPAALAAELDVSSVSLGIVYADGHTDQESEITDLAAYWRELADLAHLPTTSQPSVGAFIECYEPLLQAGRDIVSIHLSAQISGTTAAAQLAADTLKEQYPERTIAVCDSRTAGGGLAMVVAAAATAAQNGDDVSAVTDVAEKATADNRIWFAVDTLEYLRRGGRIGSAQAWIGSALRIKPILSCDGEIEPIERVRTSKRAFERLLAFAEELRDGGRTTWILQHIQAPEEAARLEAEAKRILGTEPLMVAEVGPVIGTHVGPGLLGIGGVTPF